MVPVETHRPAASSGDSGGVSSDWPKRPVNINYGVDVAEEVKGEHVGLDNLCYQPSKDVTRRMKLS